MNALIATLVAFRNWGKLNFISVTSRVPPTTSTSDAVSMDAPTNPRSTIAVPPTRQAPMRPIRVARSKRDSFRVARLATQARAHRPEQEVRNRYRSGAGVLEGTSHCAVDHVSCVLK